MSVNFTPSSFQWAGVNISMLPKTAPRSSPISYPSLCSATKNPVELCQGDSTFCVLFTSQLLTGTLILSPVTSQIPVMMIDRTAYTCLKPTYFLLKDNKRLVEVQMPAEKINCVSWFNHQTRSGHCGETFYCEQKKFQLFQPSRPVFVMRPGAARGQCH